MAKQMMPHAVLDERANDIELPYSMYREIALFQKLRKPPSLERFPGSVRLRHFRAGESICEHGEAGWSAFYVLTSEDVNLLRQHPARRLKQIQLQLVQNEQQLRDFAARRNALENHEGDQSKIQQETDRLNKSQQELQSRLAALQAERQAMAIADESLQKQMPLAHKEDAVDDSDALAIFERVKQEARARDDGRQVEFLEDLSRADAARQRLAADSLESSDPELASALHGMARTLDKLERVGIIRLPRPRDRTAQKKSVFARVKRFFGGTEDSNTPEYIPSDGPRDISSKSRTASLYAGEIVGEFSCLYRTPRSATIVALRDCYVIEMLRNVLDTIQRDEHYQKHMAEVLRQRMVESSLRQFSIFGSLTEQQLIRLFSKVEYLQFAPGTLICDEHEPSDCMYIIGNGTVKILKNVSWLLPVEEVVAGALTEELEKCRTSNSDLERQFWRRLCNELPDGERQVPADVNHETLVHSLNNLIKDPNLCRAGAFWRQMAQHQLGVRIWKFCAKSDMGSGQHMRRCNRLIMAAVLGQAFPVVAAHSAGTEIGGLLAQDEVANWAELCRRLAIGQEQITGPEAALWTLLPTAAHDAICKGTQSELPSVERQAIVSSLNHLLKSIPLMLFAEMQSPIMQKRQLSDSLREFLSDNRAWTDFEFQRWNRALNRLLLETICPSLTKAARPTGPDTILVYRARDELIGEIGLFENQPRSSTCVAYNHPDYDPDRESGPVQMFRISRAAFDELLETVPSLRAHIRDIITTRQRETREKLERPRFGAGGSLVFSDRGEKLGLIQGQQLMLIDLDRCTRCDDCVGACVSSHDDGHSRLFLNGPRIDKYLVPSTCRSCLDPVCMIGCPVGSIHRGDSKEIIIEDWCIGCGLCAVQCPYGAIQMQSTSIVPEDQPGWRFAPGPMHDERWTERNFNDRSWPAGQAPFVFERGFRDALASQTGTANAMAVYFRRGFSIPAAALRPDNEYTLTVTSTDPRARVWLNGAELKTEEKAKSRRDPVSGLKRQARLFPLFDATSVLGRSRNVLALQVDAKDADETGILLDARIDSVRRIESSEMILKPVSEIAVVCDLCSSLPSGPACVSACPHDAAMRVDARSSFPGR